MNILSKKPVTLAEAKELVNNLDANESLKEYFKKFLNLSKEKSETLKSEILALNNPKIKELDVIKVVDFLPETSEDVNKIFNDVSLTEEEVNALLNIVKKA